MSLSNTGKTATLVIGDLACFSLALGGALLARYGGAPERYIVELYLFAAPFLFLLWLAVFASFGLYDLRLAKNEPQSFERIIRAVLMNLVVTVVLFYFITEFGIRPIRALLVTFLFLGISIAVWRSAYYALLPRYTKERILFAGVTPEVAALAAFLQENPQLGFLPIAVAAEPNGDLPPGTGTLARYRIDDSLPNAIRREAIDLVVIAPTIKRTSALIRALFGAIPLGVTITDFDRFSEAVEGKVPVSLISETWFLENLIGQRRPRYEFAKRVLDLTLAVAAGAILICLMPIIAAAMVAATPRDILRWRQRRARAGDGIIFFRQQRVGRHGRVFDFMKFRSQILGAERLGSEKGERPDPRSYAVGTFLRKTYLDELPQLWNVIRGEMSFVGPRPERPEFVAELEHRIPFYRMRELVLPGITGWAQINMKNDASVSDAPEKLQYDLFYIKNRSLFLDLSILLKTGLALLQRSGR